MDMNIVIIKGFFLKYLLLPLIIMILAMVLAYIKEESPEVKGKELVLYILLSGLCLALPGFLGFTGNMFNPFWYLLSMLVYLFLGILNVSLLKSYFYDPDIPLWVTIFFESLITVICMLFGSYLFFLIFNWISPYDGYAFMATTSILIFIVPLSFYYCYLQFISIPFDIYKTWQHSSESNIVDFDKIEYRTLLLLNLELTKSTEDGKKYLIKAKAPSDGASFGDWFFRVVDDYNYKYPNNIIRLYNSDNEPYSWIFYIKKSIFHFRRFIDFDKTINQNNITEYTFIICKRVTQNDK